MIPDWSTPDWFLLAGLLVIALVFLIGMWMHEQHDIRRQDDHEAKAVERERRAEERHEKEMAELAMSRRLTEEAIKARENLLGRIETLEERFLEYDKHLAELWEAINPGEETGQ